MSGGGWLGISFALAFAVFRLVQHRRAREALKPAPLPIALPGADTGLVRHALEQSPWAVLAARNGWPMRTEVLMGAVGRLEITLLHAHAVLQVSGHAGAAPGHTAHVTLSMRTPDPGAALQDRETLAGLLASMGHSLDPELPQVWLMDLPAPQTLSYQRGHLFLALSLHVDQLDDALAGMEALSRALTMAKHPWTALAVRRRWPLKLGRAGPSMTATVHGFEIQARLRGQDGRSRLTLRCPCPPGLPPLTLNHIDHGHGEAEAVPHLIANTLLHVRALDPVALGKDLHDEVLFEAILAVVHGYPGSSLTQERIELLSPGDLEVDLEAAIDAVADLAAALEAHPWNT